MNGSIARSYLLFSLVSVAMFRSSSTFLNNSFSMITTIFAYTAWFSNALPVRTTTTNVSRASVVVLVGGVLHRSRFVVRLDLCGHSRVTSQPSESEREICLSPRIPIAVDIFLRRRMFGQFIWWSLISAAVILVSGVRRGNQGLKTCFRRFR